MTEPCHNCSRPTKEKDVLHICKKCFGTICEERDSALNVVVDSAKTMTDILEEAIPLMESIAEDLPDDDEGEEWNEKRDARP